MEHKWLSRSSRLRIMSNANLINKLQSYITLFQPIADRYNHPNKYEEYVFHLALQKDLDMARKAIELNNYESMYHLMMKFKSAARFLE